MRQFAVRDEQRYTTQDIQEIASDCFGEIDDEQTNANSFTIYPQNPVVQKITITVTDNEVGLDFDTCSPFQVINHELEDNVKQVIKSKNNFIEQITGKDIEQRKQEMKEAVLPDTETISYPT